MGAERPGAEGSGSSGHRFPRSGRVRRGVEIRELFRRGKRGRTSHLDVFISASPVSHSRIGIVVPKHRRRVVDRNLVRRRLREIARIELLPRLREAGVVADVLIRARTEAYGSSYQELRDQLVEYVERLCRSG